MKKFLLLLLCLFVFSFSSYGDESNPEEPCKIDFITDKRKCYSIACHNKEAIKQVEKYCTPKCKITALIIMDTYIHKIIKIETAE